MATTATTTTQATFELDKSPPNGQQVNMDSEMLQPIRTLLIQSLSNESHNKVKEIIKNVEQLSKFERLMLYMDLPTSQLVTDPLRQPINPLGSRSEIQLTITWIRTHLEEDPQVSLPKHEVYDEYMDYCSENGMKALSTADFGKVMKQVYPQVRPRRLGTRGNSRYCYAGLKKKVKLEDPDTPECKTDCTNQPFQPQPSAVDDAAIYLVLEWVEQLFKKRIKNVKELGLFLLDKMYVGNQSSAAHTLLSSVNMTSEATAFPEGGQSNGHASEPVKRKKTGNMAVEVVVNIDSKRKRLENMADENTMVIQSLPSDVLDTKVDDYPDEASKVLPKAEKEWDVNQAEKNPCEDEINSYFSDVNGLEVEAHANKNDKLSQLRQLLEKNLKSATPVNEMPGSAFRPTAMDADAKSNWNNFGSAEANSGPAASPLCQRRKVSFDPIVVQDTGNGSAVPAMAVQPSPGTRKRHFSFQPISPRQNSLPQSPNASPFISPRSTPVPPMLRSRHSSGSALPLHLLPQGAPKNQFGSSSSDTSRAATFGSTSECSTPFISPHGTPIPFNRSRHNSAQGRLCRSRHSSGVGPYRYNMPFSPMALNNLNNPYSPQPSTPVTNQDDNLIAILTNDNQRSRHSSAESEPPMRTVIMSPTGVDKVFCDNGIQANSRQRHASAGQATSFINREAWSSVMDNDNEKLLGDMKPSSAAIDTLKDDESGVFDAQVIESPLYEGGGQMFEPVTTSTVGASKEDSRRDNSNLPDDLDITLSALKDCDNDFSKIVQEAENGK